METMVSYGAPALPMPWWQHGALRTASTCCQWILCSTYAPLHPCLSPCWAAAQPPRPDPVTQRFPSSSPRRDPLLLLARSCRLGGRDLSPPLVLVGSAPCLGWEPVDMEESPLPRWSRSPCRDSTSLPMGASPLDSLSHLHCLAG